MATIVSPRFYVQKPLEVAHRLIGKRLVVSISGHTCTGRITETEAYMGTDDPACHAFNGRRGANEAMYARGGIAYVYFTYGMHFMFNVVVGRAEFPSAVLIRAVSPESGIEAMQERRGIEQVARLAQGPGNLCKAFGIDKSFNGIELCGPVLWLENTRIAGPIKTSPRIGIGDRWADKPWRFYLAGDPSVSGPPRWRK